MAIADDDIDKVRAALSIVDVIQPHVALKRVGRNWVGLCPFHAEKSGSFNVREETGRYKCFGCGAGGDSFKFVQEFEHVDFVTSVERLAAKAGITLTYTTGGESRDRQRRKRLIDAMGQAVEWYHQRLLTSPDARAARDYLRTRGLGGDIAREFKIGWAPDDWDVLSRGIGLPADVLTDTGLAFMNRRNRLQDAFRGRVMFPIFTADGDPVALGGRVLPGSADPAKYKNSPETTIYAKSKTFYGLNWAKQDVVASNEVVVCEGYTDVIGFHRAGIKRVVATCGTALTEEHVRTLKRYATRVVLAFDADAAGQGAAARFYEWEQKYDVEVAVAQFPSGRDPADLAGSHPELLRTAVGQARSFLGFRIDRAIAGPRPESPEQRVRLAEKAMALVNEHPNVETRKLYAGQLSAHLDMRPSDLMRLAERRGGRLESGAAKVKRRLVESTEFVVLSLLLSRWDDVAEWMSESLFDDELMLRTFRVIASVGGDLGAAEEVADPEVLEVLQRAAVVDVDNDPFTDVRTLVRAAARRELARVNASDLSELHEVAEVRHLVEQLDDSSTAEVAAGALLQWLDRHFEEST